MKNIILGLNNWYREEEIFQLVSLNATRTLALQAKTLGTSPAMFVFKDTERSILCIWFFMELIQKPLREVLARLCYASCFLMSF